MGRLDNGGMTGKKMDLTATDSYLTTTSGTGIRFVGYANGSIAASTGTNTTASLTALTGGTDVRPLANDIIIVSYSISGLQNTVDPGAFGSSLSNTTDAWAAATISLKPNVSAGSSNTITYVAGSTANISGSAATTTSVNLPGPPSANDLVIVTYGIGSSVSRTAQFTIAGWTTLAANTDADTYDANMGVFYKIMGSTPDTTVTIPATGATTDSGAVAIQTWRNINLTTPIESYVGATATNGRRPDPAAVRPSTNNAIIVICGEGSHIQPGEAFTAPTGYSTNFMTVTGNANTNMTTVGMGYRTTPYEVQNEVISSIYNPTTPPSYTNITKLFGLFQGFDGTGRGSIGFNTSYRIMGATPNTDVILPPTGSTTGAGAYGIHVWRYVDTTTPLDVTPQTFVASNGSSTLTANSISTLGTRQPNPPAITPITSGAVIVAAGGTATGSIAAAYTNTGLDNFLTSFGDDTNDGVIGMYSANWTSGAYDPTAFTVASDVFQASAAAVTIALRPATINVTTAGNKVYSGIWSPTARYLAKAVEPEVARIVGYTTSRGTTTATSINIVAPTQIRQNDLIIITACNGNATDTAQFDNSTFKPTGFTLIQEVGNSVSDTHCAAFYKVANGTEGGTTINVPAQSSDYMCATCFVIRGANVTNPIGNQGANTNVDAVTSTTIPGIVTTSNHSIVFSIASTDGADTIPFFMSSNSSLWLDANMIEVASGGTTAGSALLTAWKIINTSGDSSETLTITDQAADGISGVQFEVKSVY